MFSNRAFNAAFIISLAWHLICIFLVNIVVLPGRYLTRDLTSVSFLGPILEKTALDIILANRPVAVRTAYRHDPKYMHTVDKKEKLDLKNDVGGYIDSLAENKIYDALGRKLRSKKEVPGAVKKARAYGSNPGNSKDLSGLTLNREVIYQPERPALPSWIDASSPFNLEFKFMVSAEGDVKEIVPLVSCGNPEVDLIGIRYLKGWKFAPLLPGLKDEQGGSVKFIFGAEE